MTLSDAKLDGNASVPIFEKINYLSRKNRSVTSGSSDEYTDTQPKEKGKRGRKKKEIEHLSVSVNSNKLCLPLKKRHKVICAAALNLPAILPQMSPIASTDLIRSTVTTTANTTVSVCSTTTTTVVTTVLEHTVIPVVSQSVIKMSEKRKVGRPKKNTEEKKIFKTTYTTGKF